MKKRDNETLDFLRPERPKRERPAHAPHQPSSATSTEAAKRISPVFHGNRLACFRAIKSSPDGVTRKQLADLYFEGKQNYVTGPIAVLIEEHLVYEDPSRDRHGFIVRREDGSIVPRKVDGSAVLLLTPKGKAVAA